MMLERGGQSNWAKKLVSSPRLIQLANPSKRHHRDEQKRNVESERGEVHQTMPYIESLSEGKSTFAICKEEDHTTNGQQDRTFVQSTSLENRSRGDCKLSMMVHMDRPGSDVCAAPCSDKKTES